MPRLPIPRRGVANSVPPRNQPGEFTRPQNLDNIRIDPETGRPVRRPAIRKLFPQQIGGGRPVQHIAVVSRAQTFTGFTLGETSDLTNWESRISGALVGNVWLLDANWSMERDRYEDVSATGLYGDSGPAASIVSKCAIDPLGSLVATATNYTDATGHVVTRITVVDALYLYRGTPLVSGQQFPIWSIKFDTGADTRTFSLRFSPDSQYLFAGINGSLFVLKADSGATLLETDMDGWSDTTGKIAGLGVWTDSGGVSYLFCGFNGKADVGSTAGGITISNDHYASMFRAGVMKFRINASGTPVTKVNFGNGLAAASTYFEAAHGYFRVSEQSQGIPYGCYINDIDVGPDGSIYVARTNQGGGPNSSFPPDGNSPYVTVFKIGSNGVMAWEKDTQSIKAANFGGFANDFDVGVADYGAHVYTVNPSILCLAADTSNTINNRSVYAAGRTTGAGATDGRNVFRMLQTNGTMSWQTYGINLSGTIRGICVNPLDNTVLCTGDRNDDWDGAVGGAGAGDNQHLWNLQRLDGNVVRKFDLATANLDGMDVAVNPATGKTIYVSEKR